MNQATGWVQKPRYPEWGFHNPMPDLLKIAIDLRTRDSDVTIHSLSPRRRQAASASFAGLAGPSDRNLTSVLQSDPQARNVQNRGQRSTGSNTSGLLRKENEPKRPTDSKDFERFGSGGLLESYFGGPLFEKSTLAWRPTLATRAKGDVIGAKELNIPLPFNIRKVIASVGVMRSPQSTQTMLWVGPRVCISALHMYSWFSGAEPCVQECQTLVDIQQPFDVESEVTSHILSNLSPKVRLRVFDIAGDIGIFTLLDAYLSVADHVDPEWLLERDEVANIHDIDVTRKVGCIGYNSTISEEDERKVTAEVTRQLQMNLQQRASIIDPIRLDGVMKPGLKSLAPGTIDNASGSEESVKIGVSCTLWKGTSGGPCILLDGHEAGAIIGHVQGQTVLSDPFNLVIAFASGLKNELKLY